MRVGLNRIILCIFAGWCYIIPALAQTAPRFKVVALYENGGHHLAYSSAARNWLDRLAADSNFVIDYITTTEPIDSSFLSRYQLFIQLDYPPYAWRQEAVKSFEDYIKGNKGGWIGFHHATLLGEFDGYVMWNWFSNFMGGIRFKNYIPGFADGTVAIDDTTHPCMRGIPHSFKIEKEEWYIYDVSPRANVKVLASVDESSYKPASEIKMGDHPVIWTNPNYSARNIYIFMGHSPDLFTNNDYTHIFRNAIFWATSR